MSLRLYENQIIFDPIFAKFVTGSSSLSSVDFMAQHSISLGLHVSALVLLKGVLDSKGSRLVPDKGTLGYGFSCDGNVRYGTCDVSAWDTVYLGLFWVLNTDGWLMFYSHWHEISLFKGTISQFVSSGRYLNGWFRDYLWLNSGFVLTGYNSQSITDISVYSWAFLLAHLVWATGFMFLISWRGYWSELIDTISYLHIRTPFVSSLWPNSFYSPQALSIVQARLVGVSHFVLGFVLSYGFFVIGATS